QRLEELSMGNAMEPCPQRRPGLKAVEIPPRLEKRLLREVRRQIGTACEMHQVAVDGRILLLDEAVASLRVPAPKLLQQEGFPGQIVFVRGVSHQRLLRRHRGLIGSQYLERQEAEWPPSIIQNAAASDPVRILSQFFLPVSPIFADPCRDAR